MNPPCLVHNCESKIVPAGVSKRTGKPYSAFYTCPIQDCVTKFQQRPAAGVTAFNESLRDDNIKKMHDEKTNAIELAHAENIRATAIEAASRMIAAKGEGDVLGLAQQYLDWMKIEK